MSQNTTQFKNIPTSYRIIGLVLLLFVGIFFASDKVERFLWEKAQIPAPAFLLYHDADLAFELGQYYFNTSSEAYNLKKAQKYFQDSLVINASLPTSWHHLARIDFLEGNFEDALEKINMQIEVHGDTLPAAYYMRGLIYGYNQEPEKGAVDFIKFLEFKPESWAAHNDLAWMYFQIKDFKRVEEVARRGLVFAPQNPWLLNSLGLALLNLGQFQEAKDILKKAQNEATKMTSKDWGRSYPGNNPVFYEDGLARMQRTINDNLVLIRFIDSREPGELDIKFIQYVL